MSLKFIGEYGLENVGTHSGDSRLLRGRMIVSKEEKWSRISLLEYVNLLDIEDEEQPVKSLILLRLFKNMPVGMGKAVEL